MNRFRLVRKTKPSGFSWWVVEKKWLWFWLYFDSYMNEDTARTSLDALRHGCPNERREVVDQ